MTLKTRCRLTVINLPNQTSKRVADTRDETLDSQNFIVEGKQLNKPNLLPSSSDLGHAPERNIGLNPIGSS